MKKSFINKIDISVLICIIIFSIISIFTIGSAEKLLEPNSYLMIKQIIWYLIGFLLIFFIMFIGNDFLFKYAWILYIIGILNLILVLIFGATINEAKCWFKIPGIGNFQPSEFMKIILIILLSKVINEFRNKYNKPTLLQEFIFLIKICLIVGLPAILTSLEPDTGVVLIYILITLIMMFISGIRYRWFIILFTIIGACIGFILTTYFINNDLFIKIFGSSFFLRVDRLLDWSNGEGYQLTNGITAIGSSNLFGYGLNNTPIYFPEPQTDFIFAIFSNNFGFIGSIFLITLIGYFDIKLIKIAIKNKSNINKYIISGIIGMLIYQQFQNIGMTIGLMPITGITLPFISYGGSSLLSYMIMIGIILNISKENLKKYSNI